MEQNDPVFRVTTQPPAESSIQTDSQRAEQLRSAAETVQIFCAVSSASSTVSGPPRHIEPPATNTSSTVIGATNRRTHASESEAAHSAGTGPAPLLAPAGPGATWQAGQPSEGIFSAGTGTTNRRTHASEPEAAHSAGTGPAPLPAPADPGAPWQAGQPSEGIFSTETGTTNRRTHVSEPEAAHSAGTGPAPLPTPAGPGAPWQAGQPSEGIFSTETGTTNRRTHVSEPEAAHSAGTGPAPLPTPAGPGAPWQAGRASEGIFSAETGTTNRHTHAPEPEAAYSAAAVNGADNFQTGSEIQQALAAAAQPAGFSAAPVFRSQSYRKQFTAKDRMRSKGRLFHQAARLGDSMMSQDQSDIETTSSGQILRGTAILQRKRFSAAVGTAAVVTHAAKFGIRLRQDIKYSGMSRHAAFRTTAQFVGGGAIRTGRNVGRSLKDTAVELLEDTTLGRNDDFAASTPYYIKNATVTGARAVQTTYRIGRSAVQLVLHPIQTIKTVGIGLSKLIVGSLAALLLISLVSSAATAMSLSYLRLTAEDQDINDAWLHITKLDAALLGEIRTVPSSIAANEYHFYLNGVEIRPEYLRIQTDAEVFLAYLNAKFSAYSFSAVRSEIDSVHSMLYTVSVETQTISSSAAAYSLSARVRPAATPSPTPRSTPKPTPTPTPTRTPPPRVICSIRITAINLADYLQTAGLLNDEQQQQYQLILDVGVSTFMQELSNPFPGTDWSDCISSRYGWRWHPVTKDLRQHNGLDLALPEGTPVSNVLEGYAATGYHDDLGYYVLVVSADSRSTVRYAHLKSCSVSPGQYVPVGAEIGLVGSTGVSTGPHLHIEYAKDGQTLNPVLYLARS